MILNKNVFDLIFCFMPYLSSQHTEDHSCMAKRADQLAHHTTYWWVYLQDILRSSCGSTWSFPANRTWTSTPSSLQYWQRIIRGTWIWTPLQVIVPATAWTDSSTSEATSDTSTYRLRILIVSCSPACGNRWLLPSYSISSWLLNVTKLKTYIFLPIKVS